MCCRSIAVHHEGTALEHVGDASCCQSAALHHNGKRRWLSTELW